MALQACRSGYSPCWCRNYRLWSSQWTADSHCALFWRVSILRFFQVDFFPRPILTSISQSFWVEWSSVLVMAQNQSPTLLSLSKVSRPRSNFVMLLVLKPLHMKGESGVIAAVESFHRNLPVERMRCHAMPNQAAVWTFKRGKREIKLSKPAVQTLIDNNNINPKDLREYALLKQTSILKRISKI